VPKVSGKSFPYTAKGKAAAKAYAKTKGKGLTPSTDSKGSGGVTPLPPAKKQK